MESIKTTFFTISTLSVFLGVIKLIANTEKSSWKKYINLIVSLLIITLLLSPINEILKELNNFINIFENQNDPPTTDLYVPIERSIGLGVKNMLCDKLAIPKNSLFVTASVIQENNEYIINNLTITINQREYFSYAERIESYLKSTLGCEILINYTEDPPTE